MNEARILIGCCRICGSTLYRQQKKCPHCRAPQGALAWRSAYALERHPYEEAMEDARVATRRPTSWFNHRKEV